MNQSDLQKQLAKLRRDKRLLWLGVLFFVIVVLWILISVFTVTKTSSISPELRELAKSFVPRLESKIFDEIILKKAYVAEDLGDFPIYIYNKKSPGAEMQMIDITAAAVASEAALTSSEENSSSESTESAEIIESTADETLGSREASDSSQVIIEQSTEDEV